MGELFCGPGGIGLAAKEVKVETSKFIYKIEHAWANDYDNPSCETFRNNICPNEPTKVICQDVRKLDINNLSKISTFAYGFPCNDFSVVGEKKGFNGEFGPLYTYGIKVLERFEPDWFFAENVGGLRSADSGRTFKMILSHLERAGPRYHLTPHLYKFEDYGVPQTRHRIIIIGIKDSFKTEFKVPAPTHVRKYITAREALKNIPFDAANQELTKQSPVVVDRLKCIRPGENAWTANLPSHLKLNVKRAKLSQIYRRLDPSRPAYTVTGSGGGGTHGYHWREDRALTNRERARLQTFPDDFIFEGSKESVRRQIGMAVPPLGAKVILEAVLKTFAGIEYPYISPNGGGKEGKEVKQGTLFEEKRRFKS